METLIETKPFFIVYKPKDIVSGDFYYALSHKHLGSKKEIFYMSAADCTGHGVPGALMSMMAVSKLNESIIEKNLIAPNDILDNVRKGIIASLNPEGSEEESKDGMDCVLCAFDFEEMKLDFAAANNPLWLIRDGAVIEFKPDKMPVGKSPKENEPYTLQSIQLQKGDTIYIFTDGYADQFGGEKGKKFKYKQLQDLLLKNCSKSMEEQKQLLSTTIEKWMGNLEQVDDILVIGIKI
ncbi:MAG: serine/threonine-protein phosphatase [Bacteroidetes bacterium]|nr:serine/threonine-protein phosphatase [Bacteroidota bacterium]